MANQKVQFFDAKTGIELTFVGYDYEQGQWRRMSPQRWMDYLEEDKERERKGWKTKSLKEGKYTIE